MNDEAGIAALLDEHAISKTVTAWGFARDQGNWEALKACFHPDATMNVSWFSGSAHAFIESLTGRPPHRPGEHTKHLIGAPRMQIEGTRAVSECHITLFSRAFIDEMEFDFEAWVRFFDLFEKRDGAWRIFKRTAIYEKDRMEAVKPDEVPEWFFAEMKLEEYPPECRFMCFRHSKQGRSPAPNIVGASGEAERRLREEGERWLAGE